MHLVCLGVTKRLLQLWVKVKRTVGLSAENVISISDQLIKIRPCISSEFVRKPRNLHDLDRWKTTEFRQFVLYTGIFVLKSIMRPKHCDHFVSLSVAMRILSDPHLCISFNTYANSLLVWFVSNFGVFYGKEYLTHNIHNLIHLFNDAKVFSGLDNINCFKFENYMQKIKKRLHQSGKPLEELTNRITEETQTLIQPHELKQYPIAVYEGRSQLKKISYIQYKNFKIANRKNDNCLLSDNNSILLILHIFKENNIICASSTFHKSRIVLYSTV